MIWSNLCFGEMNLTADKLYWGRRSQLIATLIWMYGVPGSSANSGLRRQVRRSRDDSPSEFLALSFVCGCIIYQTFSLKPFLFPSSTIFWSCEFSKFVSHSISRPSSKETIIICVLERKIQDRMVKCLRSYTAGKKWQGQSV